MDPALAAYLTRLETALARRDATLVDEPLAALLDSHFVEHGASGTRWSREDVGAMLDDGPNAVELEDVAVSPIGDGAALVTYRSVDPAGRIPDAWRASVWVRAGGRWRLRFHQGTRLPSAGRIA